MTDLPSPSLRLLRRQVTEQTSVRTFRRPEIVKTRDLRIPNAYTLALLGELCDFAFDEERAPQFRGRWRDEVFKAPGLAKVDLEIGTGNGVHFRERCRAFPERFLVGLELKFKPLVQTIRGMLRLGCHNGRVCRAHAFNLDLIFDPGEVDDIFMHFPDPWTSPRKPKNRMVNERMVDVFAQIQKPSGYFELKTDSADFFFWAIDKMNGGSYREIYQSQDWHQDSRSAERVRTQFEKIFATQGLPIYYSLWQKQ